MQMPRSTIPASLLALAIWSNRVGAQTVVPPPDAPIPSGTSAALYDPQQLPAIRGELERLTLTGRGDIDGLILKDGTEVKTDPNLSTQIAYAIKPGDRVTIHGLRAAALPLVRAVSVTDESTHRTVTDAGGTAPMGGPPPRPARPPPPAPGPALDAMSETAGRVRMALHGPQGEVNGVLLESGTILRFPPDQAPQLTSLLQPRQSLVAEGLTVTTALGTVVDVQRMGTSRDRLVAVGAPMPLMDDRGPAGPRLAHHRPRRPPRSAILFLQPADPFTE